MPKTCLLISEDPDDHQIIFEAIKEISSTLVLIIALDIEHLHEILKGQKIQPDYIIVDAGIRGIANNFLPQINHLEHLKNTPVIVCADDTARLADYSADLIISKRLPYSELKLKLRTALSDVQH
jgi:hypothetical protein